MTDLFHRRKFLRAASVAAAALPGVLGAAPDRGPRKAVLRVGLNSFSFNEPLRNGELTLMDVVDFCAEHRIDYLDATGYYFPGYPLAPPDEFVYALKRRAFLNGVAISGTGVRNDFAVSDETRRTQDLGLVKRWIAVAEKMGASVIRVFSGAQRPQGYSFDEALNWMVPLFRECAREGEKHGVLIGLQNHNDFLKTAAETIRVVEAVDSKWFGVILDIGSLRKGDPYEEIERLLPYAISWQVKETVWYGEKEVATDLPRLKRIVEKSGYRGVLPIETLGAGDPRIKVARFAQQVREVLNNRSDSGA
ncbi:MAG: sugar phosphate isomerase/epimerase [Bryobacterales bacterium]|nr:sugar phosphate isomerase/epimerase [Bryobacterales bacterium]